MEMLVEMVVRTRESNEKTYQIVVFCHQEHPSTWIAGEGPNSIENQQICRDESG